MFIHLIEYILGIVTFPR